MLHPGHNVPELIVATKVLVRAYDFVIKSKIRLEWPTLIIPAFSNDFVIDILHTKIPQ